MIKLGVIGTSWITESFLKAVAYFPNIQLSAVMSPRQSSVDRFMDKYPFKKGYTDYETLLNDKEIDLLYIASPNSAHYSQTKQALLRKIPVLCEKPITLSVEELEELERIANQNNVCFMEAMRPVHHPHIPIIKEAVNKLDGLQYAHLKMMQYSSKYDAYKSGELPRVFNPEYGGGALNDLGVYPLTLAVLLFGKPTKLSVESVALESGVDATTVVNLNYGSFICQCTFSKVSNTYTSNELVGEKKTLLLSHVTHLDELILVEEEKTEVLIKDTIEDDMRFELSAFIDMIENQDAHKFQEFLSITKIVTEICDEIRHEILRDNNKS
jgi:scyllo-inositol 2-dehydrogenase (NADP+)